jgi:aspartate carbamoyltransferase catalytic subunit
MFHALSAAQFSKTDLTQLLDIATKMDEILASDTPCELAKGKVLATYFLEPSTRTRLSFEASMLRLGGGVISVASGKTSSASKGETIADAARCIGGYADVIAMRTKIVGSAIDAAGAAGVPVLNGGDGAGEHPTQGLLDLYTISKYFDLEAPLKVAFVGDLKYGRTVHSLSTILRHYTNVELSFVAPDALQLPEKYKKAGDTFTENLDDVLETADVIYDTRIQQERFPSEEEYLKFKGAYIFDVDQVKKMKPTSALMHPLPRVNEITPAVDVLPQARYFEQAANGVPMRMALIVKALELL